MCPRSRGPSLSLCSRPWGVLGGVRRQEGSSAMPLGLFPDPGKELCSSRLRSFWVRTARAPAPLLRLP